MSEREITITLKGKNLTADAFAQARAELSGLNDVTGKASKSGDDLTLSWGKVAGAATAVVGVVAGIGAVMATAAAGIAVLGERGAEVSDVRQQFDILNVSAGNVSGTMLGTLRSALKGTVSDFEIMKSTNAAVSLGLKLNETQFELTARASRVLADRVGGDTADAYGKLTLAMATGQDRALKEIGLNIDAESAVKRYADSLGYEVGQLTEAEKTAAKRQAILTELTSVLKVSGDAEIDFADIVDQGTVSLSNFYDEVSEGIAQSPVLAAAFGPISTALSEAFGPHKQQLIGLIIRGIEEAAMITLKLGEVGISVAETLTSGYFSVRNTLVGTVATVKEALASLPGATDGMKRSAEEWRAKANESEQAGEMFASMLGRLRAGLSEARGAMQAASLAQRENAIGATQQAVSQQAAAVAIASTGSAANSAAPPVNRLTKEQTAAAKSAADLWKEVEKLNGQNLSLSEMVNRGIFGKFTTELKDTVSLVSRANAEAGQMHAELMQWATVNGAVLAPSIREVGSTLDETSEKASWFRESWSGAMTDLPNVILGAIQGGGSAWQAAGSHVGTSMMKGFVEEYGPLIESALPFGIGKAVTSMLPTVGALLGPLSAKIAGVFKNIFGGPSEGELAGRQRVADFEAQLKSTLSETQKLETGTEAWKQTVVALRDSYIAQGRTAEEAMADAERLWKSSKQGPEAVAAVIADIQAKMKGTAVAAASMSDDIRESLNRIPREIAIEVNGKYNAPDIDGGSPGYNIGTKGRHGSYFVNFGQGASARLHGYEAVITPSQAPGFVEEYLQRNPGAASPTINVYTVAEINATTGQVTQRPISQQEYLRRQMQKLLSAGALTVPQTAVGTV